MFAVEGVEVKKCDMSLGHKNPLDGVCKLGHIRRACQARGGQSAGFLTWVARAQTDNIMMR
eukprot:9596405-Lingulodinium_polyedra.AAC.1